MVVGKHVAANLYDVKRMLPPAEARELMVKAAEAAGSRVYDVRLYEFRDGYSVLVLVLESHLAIHTWYDVRFATVDIYTCGGHTDPDRALQLVLAAYEPDRVTVYRHDRSSRSNTRRA